MLVPKTLLLLPNHICYRGSEVLALHSGGMAKGNILHIWVVRALGGSVAKGAMSDLVLGIEDILGDRFF